MFKSITIIYLFFLPFSISQPNQVYAQVQLNSVFINWNKYTFESLNRQTQLAADSMQKSIYENRCLAVKKYWGIDDVADCNSKSIRYKFLKTILLKANDRKKKDFYVIEANESGSKVLLRSCVLFMDAYNIANVDFYDFYNGEWRRVGKFRKENFALLGLKNNRVQFGKGFNYDDIVITEFKNGRIKESEYYLYSTLSAESKVNHILDGYRKENFIK
jgi:hypothetical protein